MRKDRTGAIEFLNKVLPPIEFGESSKGILSLTNKRYKRFKTVGKVIDINLVFLEFLVDEGVLDLFILNTLQEQDNLNMYSRSQQQEGPYYPKVPEKHYVLYSFDWSSSPQGYQFWNIIKNKWIRKYTST